MRNKLGHFDLLEPIGHGELTSVYKAYDSSLNRMVAIKILNSDAAGQDSGFVGNFLREARSAAAINHPNIVQIYFVGEDNGTYYIVMELLEGRSLDEIIKEEGPQDEAKVLQIGIQMADALRVAYASEMIHGDIKPQNIFMTSKGVAKMLDFGLAKIADVESAMESESKGWGSAYYISPERSGHKAEDFRSDIYSLGATLFHALVGHPPFEADSLEELEKIRSTEKAPQLRGINPDLSRKTDQIIERMLNKSAFLRYLDYNVLLNDLREALAMMGRTAKPVPLVLPAGSGWNVQAAETGAQPALAVGNPSVHPVGNPGASTKGMPIMVISFFIVAVVSIAGAIAYFFLAQTPASTPAASGSNTAGGTIETGTMQLLKNASFEETGPVVSKAAYWESWGSIERMTAWVPTHEGSCLVAYLHRAVSENKTSGISQEIQNAKPGRPYKFSVHVMSAKPLSGTRMTAKIELWLDSIRDGKKVKIASAEYYPILDAPADDKWHQLSVTGTSPDNKLRAVIEFTPSSDTPRGGTIKIDDASLQELH